MLGIILTYHSFFEFLPYQVQNLKKHIPVPFKIYLVDNSLLSGQKYSGDVVYIYSLIDGSPSQRHQQSVNLGLARAWNECDSFLILDNDMIFLSDWTPPPICQYHPQKRGNLVYAWLNLLYFPKDDRLNYFDFANCPDTRARTDSGGSFAWYLRSGGSAQTIDMLPMSSAWFPQYSKAYEELCTRHEVRAWYDIFRINNSIIFHFRALSNWTKYPEAFQREKKELILTTLNTVKV
jgi:hypothetical protein